MKQRDIAIILIPAFIIVLFWVIFNVYHSFVSSTITDPLSYLIKPIEGNFDKKTITEIKSRKRVSPANEIIVQISTSPTPTPLLQINNATTSANTTTNNQTEGL